MAPNAVIIAVIVTLFLIADARLDPSADADAVSLRDPREDADSEKAAVVSVDLRQIRASLPLTTIGGDRDISRQIAHSLRLPNLNRHVPRPLRHPPVEIPYGHDMIDSSKVKKVNKIKKERDDDSDSDDDDDDDEIEEEKKMNKRLKKMMKKKLKMEREKELGGFKKWISGFLNRF